MLQRETDPWQGLGFDLTKRKLGAKQQEKRKMSWTSLGPIRRPCCAPSYIVPPLVHSSGRVFVVSPALGGH